MKKNNRRDFIGKSLMGLPLALFTESIFHSIVNKAMGEETALSDMNFLSLYFPSGPARWCFDLPLGDKNNLSYRPQSTNVNTMLINSFITNANGIVGGEFKQTFFQGEVVPWIWESQVSDENGNLVPLKPMLQNMLMAQGLNLSADGHDSNRDKMLCAVPGGYSITGMMADAGSAPFSAVAVRNSHSIRVHKSPSGLSIVNTDANNPIEELLRSFSVGKDFRFNRANLSSFFEQTFKAFEKNSSKEMAMSYRDRVQAKSLYVKNFGNLNDIYRQKSDKYKKIITNTLMNATLPGFSNLIVRGATSAYEVQSSNKGTITIGQNLQDTILSTSVINEIVPSLVMMEFILENKLSQNIHGSVGELNGLNIPFTGPTDLVKLDGFNNDSHNTGSLATLFYFTKYYQAVGACLLAFTQHLKKIGQFDKSIIFINSEFNRSARNDGSGSDHGWDGSNFSLLSGAIDGLKVIGSVKKDTYGVSHPVVELANRDMSIGNVHSSLAAILKVKSPTPNDQSFLGLKDNKVVTFIGKKNV